MAGARNSGDWPEAGVGWELGIINLKVHFFLGVREFFVLHRMVGRTQRGVLTPGYFERVTFLHREHERMLFNFICSRVASSKHAWLSMRFSTRW